MSMFIVPYPLASQEMTAPQPSRATLRSHTETDLFKWYRELAELIAGGIGMHHAGMLRSDRNLTERLFRDGILKVSVSIMRSRRYSNAACR